MSFLGSHELYIIHNILPYIFLQIDRTIHTYIYIYNSFNIDLLPWRRSECLGGQDRPPYFVFRERREVEPGHEKPLWVSY